jgi:hypothetical protein
MSGQDLIDLADRLEPLAASFEGAAFQKDLARLRDAANEIARAWSGSNLGYHSRVYYETFEAPPPGASFSVEWGLTDDFDGGAAWREYRFNDVVAGIRRRAGNPDLSAAHAEAMRLKAIFELTQPEMISSMTVAVENRPDPYLKKLLEQAEAVRTASRREYLSAQIRTGQVFTRDMTAMTQGTQAAPHQSMLAEILEIKSPATALSELSKLARQAGSHLLRVEKGKKRAALVGTNVFIGHGRSAAWRDLKEFIQDRLHLPWDEFNRVPVAGVTNIARLLEMLDAAAIAFIILTGEDEQADGTMHARLNAVHEAGLFQGRLGFTKAIVLIEEGCEGFSNIEGLGQIRFPKDNIAAAFEDIRRVLEREGLIT